MNPSVTVPTASAASRAEVLRWNSLRIQGAAIPPTMSAPATMAATRPAIP